MTKKGLDLPGDDVHLGTEEIDPGSVLEILRLPDGRAVMLPRSPLRRQVAGEALQALADLQGTVRQLEKLRQDVDELVTEARDLGVTWSVIGFSVGMSSAAARKRWLDA